MVTNALADLFGPSMLLAAKFGVLLTAFLLLVWGGYEGYTKARRWIRRYRVKQEINKMQGRSVVQPKLGARFYASSERQR